MVKNSITDGKRIAQLLASELTGLRTGGLDTVSVEQADPNAMPSETGTLAYRIFDDDTPITSVYLYPAYIELQFTESRPPESATTDSEGAASTVQITSGAEVKDAVDLVRETAQ